MADNTTLNAGTGGDPVVTREITHSGDTAKLQGVFLMGISGTEGAYTAGAIDGSAADGLLVNLGLNNDVVISDGGATISIDDGAGSLTVDGAVTATLAAETTKVIGTVNIAAAQTLATVTTVSTVTNVATVGTSVTPGTSAAHLGKAVDSVAGATDTGVAVLAVRDDSLSALTPADGDYTPLRVSSTGALHVTGGGGGTQYNVDSASTGTDTGTLSLAIRDDALTTLTPADGDYVPLRTTSTGALHVNVTSGGVQGIVDDAAFTAATSEGVLLMGAATADTVDSGDAGALAMTTARALHVSLQNVGSVVVPISDNSGSITVDGTVAVSGTVAVTDNAGSLTVDAPVGTPVYVRLSDGASAITTLPVSLASVPSHAVTNAGTFATQVDGAALTALQLLDNSAVADDAAFTAGTTGVNVAGFVADETTTDSVDEGDAGAARMTLDRKVIVTPYAHAAAGGATPYYNLDVDETEDEIKATAGKLFWLHAVNLSASKLYLKFYNATAANVTVGTTTPVLSFPVPTMADTNGCGFTINFGAMGVQFSTAITVACTTGLADNSTGAPGANEMVVNLGYL